MKSVTKLLLVFALATCNTLALPVVIHKEKSLYRNISVYEENGLRCMQFGLRTSAVKQTCIELSSPDKLVFEYTKMVLGALYLQPTPNRILVIGLGGGAITRALQNITPESYIDVVEIDPSVVKVAKKYFLFSTNERTQVLLNDGRVYIKRALKNQLKYDIIILDAFEDIYLPEHMLTREYLIEVKKLLSPKGVLVSNTFSASRMFFSESATYASVFSTYYNLQLSNRVILAQNEWLEVPSELKYNANALESKLNTVGIKKEWLLPLFKTKVIWPKETRILTDQYSPGNLLNN